MDEKPFQCARFTSRLFLRSSEHQRVCWTGIQESNSAEKKVKSIVTVRSHMMLTFRCDLLYRFHQWEMRETNFNWFLNENETRRIERQTHSPTYNKSHSRRLAHTRDRFLAGPFNIRGSSSVFPCDILFFFYTLCLPEITLNSIYSFHFGRRCFIRLSQLSISVEFHA